MTKKTLIFIILIVILLGGVILASVYYPEKREGEFVDFQNLVLNPESYQDKKICTEGIYFTNWEYSILDDDPERLKSYKNLSSEANNSDYRIWIDNRGSGQKVKCQWCRVKVVVCGTFESDEVNYGNLASARHQITKISLIKVLEYLNIKK